MHNLQAQLRLDAAQVWNPRIIFGLAGLAVVFLFIGGHEQGVHMAVSVLGMIGLLCSTGPFVADRTYGLNRLYGQLPTTRTTVVLCHYLVGGIAFVGAAFVSALFAVLVGDDQVGAVSTAVAATAAVAVVTAVAIPTITRFGQQSLVFVSFGLVAVGVAAVKAIPHEESMLVDLLSDAAQHPMAASAFLVGAVLLLWIVSYLVTLRIYRKQDL